MDEREDDSEYKTLKSMVLTKKTIVDGLTYIWNFILFIDGSYHEILECCILD